MTTEERFEALEKSGRWQRLIMISLTSFIILVVVVAALLNQGDIRIETRFNTDAKNEHRDTADDHDLLRTSIETQNAEYMASFNSQDPAGVAILHTENAVVMPPNHPAVKGREDIQKFIEADIQAGLRDLSLTTLTLDAADGVASEMGQYSLNIEIDGSESKPDSGKYVVVWKRQPGGVWLIDIDIWNSDLPNATE
jgi:ketosteroid isomerase-like protein